MLKHHMYIMSWKKSLKTMTLPFAKFAWEVLVPVKNGRMFTLPRFVDCEFSCGHDAMHWWTQFVFRVTKNGGETSHNPIYIVLKWVYISRKSRWRVWVHTSICPEMYLN